METLKWHTPEYIYTEKTSDWYWIVGIVSITLALIAIILNNLIFGILILVSTFTLSLFASRKPDNIEIIIDSSGVTIGDTLYMYKNLESYWVESESLHPKIILKSKKVFMPFLHILIYDINPDHVRETLDNYLPSEEHIQPFLEKLLVYLGF